MYLHANAMLGLAGRFALVRAVEDGMSLKAARRRFQRVAGDRASLVAPVVGGRRRGAQRSLSCLFDRSSRPHRSPRRLAPELERAICACRRETG